MKHLPKSTLTEILNDPYGFTYKEMSEVIGPVNQLKKLREEHLKIQLTISLHAATQAARNCRVLNLFALRHAKSDEPIAHRFSLL